MAKSETHSNSELISHSQCPSAPLEWGESAECKRTTKCDRNVRGLGRFFFYYIKNLNISTELLPNEKKAQRSLTLHTAAAWLAVSTLACDQAFFFERENAGKEGMVHGRSVELENIRMDTSLDILVTQNSKT